MRLGHVMTALITPFDRDGKIDFPALRRLCEKLIGEGCDGFVVCGTTGEASSLTQEEKLALLECVLRQSRGRVSVWMGCGSNNTAQTVDLIRTVCRFAVDGVMVVCPYYVRPSQEGLYAHFAACAEASSLPLMLYNVPKRTGVSLSARTVIRLAQDYPAIRVLKQACGDMEMVRRILMECETMQICSGEDGLFLEGLRAGMSGIISVAGHCVMPVLVKIWEDYQYGVENGELDHFLKQLSGYLFRCSSPSDIKAMLAMQGWCNETVRLPLVAIDDDSRRQLRGFMLEHSLL